MNTGRAPDRWVQSCCVLCSAGCGLDIGVKDGRIVGVRGRAADRVNHGRLGPKGLHGWEANSSPDRLTRPLDPPGRPAPRGVVGRGDGPSRPRSQGDHRQVRAGAMGFYNTGQLCLEEYYTLSVMADAGHRHQSPRRQHPPLHRHRRAALHGDVRHGRRTRPYADST